LPFTMASHIQSGRRVQSNIQFGRGGGVERRRVEGKQRKGTPSRVWCALQALAPCPSTSPPLYLNLTVNIPLNPVRFALLCSPVPNPAIFPIEYATLGTTEKAPVPNCSRNPTVLMKLVERFAWLHVRPSMFGSISVVSPIGTP